MRAFLLYYLSLRAMFHRLYYDLAREAVVAICALVLFSTFFYVFNDFLNVQVAQLSQSMRNSFARAAACAILGAALWAATRSTQQEVFGEDSFRFASLRLGERPSNIRTFLLLRLATIQLGFFGLAWFIIQRYLVHLPYSKILVVQAICTLLSVGLGVLMKPKQTKAQHSFRSQSSSSDDHSSASTEFILATWRLKQILFRNWITKLCLIFAFCCTGLNWLGAFSNLPAFALMFIGMVAGIFSSLSLAFQLQEDLNYAWAERNLGVSHDSFINAYSKLAILIGAATGLFASLPFLAVHFLNGNAGVAEISDTLKIFIITMVPSLIMPPLMMQIDGRKPIIQIILVMLVGAFVGTAIVAHWLGLLVLILAIYYGKNLQQGRFYRA